MKLAEKALLIMSSIPFWMGVFQLPITREGLILYDRHGNKIDVEELVSKVKKDKARVLIDDDKTLILDLAGLDIYTDSLDFESGKKGRKPVTSLQNSASRLPTPLQILQKSLSVSNPTLNVRIIQCLLKKLLPQLVLSPIGFKFSLVSVTNLTKQPC